MRARSAGRRRGGPWHDGPVLLALLATLTSSADAGVERLGAPPRLSAARAEEVLFADEEAPAEPRCAKAAERVPCLLALRYQADPAAGKLALQLWERLGSVAGLTPEHDMDGGFRGMVHLVPDLPIGSLRKHLEWVVAGMTDHDTVLSALQAEATLPFAYRWQSLEVGFYRSVKKRTPAAYASDWAVNYNTNGTLNWGPDIVRELLFHELFHLNDAEHRGWSLRALSPTYDRIVKRCGTKKECLEPWAPVETKTKGTYYAFLPANGVSEYAAELAARYYREQRAVMQKTKVTPFKCRTPENAVVWSLMVVEFFGGVDRVPACPAAK